STVRSSAGDSLQAQPAPWEKRVSRISSSGWSGTGAASSTDGMVASARAGQFGQSAMVKLVEPDSAEPPGPLASARTVPEPWSYPNDSPLWLSWHRLPHPPADSGIVR